MATCPRVLVVDHAMRRQRDEAQPVGNELVRQAGGIDFDIDQINGQLRQAPSDKPMAR